MRGNQSLTFTFLVLFQSDALPEEISGRATAPSSPSASVLINSSLSHRLKRIFPRDIDPLIQKVFSCLHHASSFFCSGVSWISHEFFGVQLPSNLQPFNNIMFKSNCLIITTTITVITFPYLPHVVFTWTAFLAWFGGCVFTLIMFSWGLVIFHQYHQKSQEEHLFMSPIPFLSL